MRVFLLGAASGVGMGADSDIMMMMAGRTVGAENVGQGLGEGR